MYPVIAFKSIKTQKHAPAIERNGNKIKGKGGSVLHPMTKEHYILFIESHNERILRSLLRGLASDYHHYFP
jgi:desulfoferrodoxin (superoxide reductase-like protein)